MRVAVTVGEDLKGEFHALLLPDSPVQDHKDLAKKIKALKGNFEGTQFKRVFVFSEVSKKFTCVKDKVDVERNGIIQIPEGEDGLGVNTCAELCQIALKEGVTPDAKIKEDKAALLDLIRSERINRKEKIKQEEARKIKKAIDKLPNEKSRKKQSEETQRTTAE